MSISAGIMILVVLLAIGALLSARAGIRSIQSARTVVFYRTRRARMIAGQQWLGVSFVLLIFTVAAAVFGRPAVYQIFPQAIPPTPTSTQTALPTFTKTNIPEATQTPNATIAPAPTLSETLPSASQTPLPPATVALTFTSRPAATEIPPQTTFAPSSTSTNALRTQATAGTQTAVRQLFIAALSATPKAT